jgi:polysaccharide export outer membrane protein
MQVTRFSPLLVAILIATLALAVTLPPGVTAQDVPGTGKSTPPAEPAPIATPAQQAEQGSLPLRATISPGDEGDLTVYGVPELTQHFRVHSSGQITMPLIGDVRIAGLTPEEAQDLIGRKLVEGGFLRGPDVTIFIKEFSSQTAAVLGEVMRPGLYPVLGSRPLYDVILLAGGLSPKAGRTITITRPKGAQKTITVTLPDDPSKLNESNVEVQAGDTIVVSRAGLVYVIGEVNRPGGFVMENNERISLLQALSMAAGPTRTASLSHARLLRRSPEGLTNTEVDVKKLLQAKTPDMPLQAEDVLYIPASRAKAAAERGTSSILTMLTSLAIYRF